jgi:low temperature requirement protein LtrA
MHVSDHGNLLRARDGGELPVTALELFFDLVFVFAVTQLSH